MAWVVDDFNRNSNNTFVRCTCLTPPLGLSCQVVEECGTLWPHNQSRNEFTKNESCANAKSLIQPAPSIHPPHHLITTVSRLWTLYSSRSYVYHYKFIPLQRPPTPPHARELSSHQRSQTLRLPPITAGKCKIGKVDALATIHPLIFLSNAHLPHSVLSKLIW